MHWIMSYDYEFIWVWNSMRVTYNFARTIPVYWHYTIIPFPIPKYLKARAAPQRAAVSSQLWQLKHTNKHWTWGRKGQRRNNRVSIKFRKPHYSSELLSEGRFSDYCVVSYINDGAADGVLQQRIMGWQRTSVYWLQCRIQAAQQPDVCASPAQQDTYTGVTRTSKAEQFIEAVQEWSTLIVWN